MMCQLSSEGVQIALKHHNVNKVFYHKIFGLVEKKINTQNLSPRNCVSNLLSVGWGGKGEGYPSMANHLYIHI